MVLMIESALNYIADYLRNLDAPAPAGRAGPAARRAAPWNAELRSA